MFILFEQVGTGLAEHAIYISVIEVSFDDESTEVTLNLKIFSDDLREAVIQSQSLEQLPLEDMCREKYRDAVVAYLNAHLEMQFDQVNTTLQWTTCRQEGEVLELRCTASCARDWQLMSIRADYLMELYSIQSQMVHYSHEGAKRTYRISKNKPRLDITR